MHPGQALKNLVDQARVWARARDVLRRLHDSKSASQKDLDKAQKQLLDDTNKLESAIWNFEVELRRLPKSQKIKLPWGKIFGTIAAGAGALEEAMREAPAVAARARQVIDTFGETVVSGAKKK